MATYTLISSQVLGSSAASVTFSSIPQTYKDLVLMVSARDSRVGQIVDALSVLFNGATSNYDNIYIAGDGSVLSSSGGNDSTAAIINFASAGNSSTANTFSSGEIYIPNYTASKVHPFSAFFVDDNNTSTAYISGNALLWNTANPITSISISGQTFGANLLTGSSFYLYGI